MDYLIKKLEEKEVKKIYCNSTGIFAVLKNKEKIKIPSKLITEIIDTVEECFSTTYSSKMDKSILFTKTNLEQLKKCIDCI